MGIALIVAFTFAVLLWLRVQAVLMRAQGVRPAAHRVRAHHDAVLLNAAAARVRRDLRSERHRGRVPGPSGAVRVHDRAATQRGR